MISYYAAHELLDARPVMKLKPKKTQDGLDSDAQVVDVTNQSLNSIMRKGSADIHQVVF